jgi:hypothetical protein
VNPVEDMRGRVYDRILRMFRDGNEQVEHSIDTFLIRACEEPSSTSQVSCGVASIVETGLYEPLASVMLPTRAGGNPGFKSFMMRASHRAFLGDY